MSSYEERMSQKYNFFSSEDKNQVSDSEVEKKTKNEEVNCKLNDCLNDLGSIITYPLCSLPKSFSRVV